MMKYLIGTDIGTSGTKSILMDTQGRLIAQDLQEYDVLTPQPLWAEQWPDVWLDAAKRSIRNTVQKSGVSPADVAGICISGLYGGSGIPLDEQMEPVRPCLIWMDRRATVQQRWVEEHIDPEKLQRITHNGTDPYYGYLKILWIRDNEPDNWRRTRLFLPPNNYVIYRLTGQVAIDYSAAGNIGGIFDMNAHGWSYELMDDMGIPRTMMPPRIVESRDIVGGLTAQAGLELGLNEGTPVCAGGVDCGVASFGLGVFEPGEYVAATLDPQSGTFTSVSRLQELSGVSNSAWSGKSAVTVGGRTYTVSSSVPCYDRATGSWLDLDTAHAYAGTCNLYVSGGAVRVIEIH